MSSLVSPSEWINSFDHWGRHSCSWMCSLKEQKLCIFILLWIHENNSQELFLLYRIHRYEKYWPICYFTRNNNIQILVPGKLRNNTYIMHRYYKYIFLKNTRTAKTQFARVLGYIWKTNRLSSIYLTTIRVQLCTQIQLNRLCTKTHLITTSTCVHNVRIHHSIVM